MAITLNGTTGITNDGGYTGDGVSFADTAPANTLVTTAGGNVGVGTASPASELHLSSVAPILTATATNGTSGLRVNIIGGSSETFRVQNNGTNILAVNPGGLFQFNSGYGSVAVAYGCRAWVNFNGTGTVAIRASGNVSSITDNGVGDYTINFTTSMPDANYSATFGARNDGGGSGANYQVVVKTGTTPTTSAVNITAGAPSNAVLYDSAYIYAAIFR